MLFLQATKEEKESLEGLYNNRSEIQFFEIEGKWYTSYSNLDNEDFKDVMTVLELLPKADIKEEDLNKKTNK